MTGANRLWSRIQQHADATAPHSGHAASVHGTRHAAGGADPLDGYYASTIHSGRHAPGGADSLSAFYETTKVSNLRGRSVQDAAPTNAQVLSWDNANAYWKPTTLSAAGGGSNVFYYETTNKTAGAFSTTSTSYVDLPGAHINFTATASAKQMVDIRYLGENNTLGNAYILGITDNSNVVKAEMFALATRADTRNPGSLKALFSGIAGGAATLKCRVRTDANQATFRDWYMYLEESTA